MERKFEGKTLLVLGSSTGAVDIVKYARENGADVTVADYCDPSQSPAKMVADQALMISTSDVDKLEQYVREKHIDGVFAGISGFNILKAMEVSKRCGLWFYCTLEQWNKIEVKDGFRKLCEQYGVPCPRTYFIGGDSSKIPLKELSYPLVIKPIDSGASRGVFICASEDELIDHFDEALDQSPASKIIIESFESGEEFTAHYVVKEGKAKLVCIDDRHPVALHEGTVTTIPIARVYPSKSLERYLEHVDKPMVALIESLNLENAVCFVQGLFDEHTNAFSVFEAGMRSAAELPNRLLARITGNDYMHFLVDMLLVGSSDYDSMADDPGLGGSVCAIVSIAARGGTVGAIEGLEESCESLKSVIDYESRYPVGSVVPDGDTLSQLMIRFVMVCDSKEELAHDIAYLNEHVQVFDDKGVDMAVRFDPTRL